MNDKEKMEEDDDSDGDDDDGGEDIEDDEDVEAQDVLVVVSTSADSVQLSIDVCGASNTKIPPSGFLE